MLFTGIIDEIMEYINKEYNTDNSRDIDEIMKYSKEYNTDNIRDIMKDNWKDIVSIIINFNVGIMATKRKSIIGIMIWN